ncbi:MAG: hypothetical protein VB034_07745 [Eubacteriales bacterium]|nr:hypothetical protein [Eubacteriales bacterium]
MTLIRISKEELAEHLLAQLQFLKSSCLSYDAGQHLEAIRIATALRILFHTTCKSESILSQLEIQNIVNMLDTSLENSPTNLLSYTGLLFTRVTTGSGITYIPLLDDSFFFGRKNLPFKKWWSEVVILDDKKHVFTRRDIVLHVADQDGGAHVDPQIDKKYYDLKKENTLGLYYSDDYHTDEPPVNNPIFPSLRQIAYEVIATFEEYFGCEISKIQKIDLNTLLNI